MKLNKNQQLKVRSDEPQQNGNKGTQPKIPQLKVNTGIRSGVCVWDPNCEKYWCY
jgi:hypothetical protein